MTPTDALFRPLAVNGLTLKNRIVMAPMARNFSPDFVPDQNVADYYARRAENGVGLIITEANHIDHAVANGYKNQPAIHGAAALSGHRNLVDCVHKAGGTIFCQLWHMGPERPENGIPNPDLPAVSPSGIKRPHVKSGRPLELAEMADVQASYARAASAARSVGYDGVEIHGAHGYLIDAFLDKETNLRTDAYGGSLANRARFAVETITMVRAAVGPDFPVSLRISQWKTQDYKAKIFDDPTELAYALQAFTDAGVDLFHCSTRRFWEAEFDGSPLSFAGWTRKLSGKPTIAVGSVTLNGTFTDTAGDGTGITRLAGSSVDANLDKLCAYLARDEFDLIAIGRALLANPDWVGKVRAGQSERLQPFVKAHLKKLT